MTTPRAATPATITFPRIYNQFPRLSGPISQWGQVLDDVAYMGFDTIWTNPFFATTRIAKPGTGQVGSLYGIRDHFMIDPDFSVWKGERIEMTRAERLQAMAEGRTDAIEAWQKNRASIQAADKAALKDYIADAWHHTPFAGGDEVGNINRRPGISLMADLVLTHVAKDHELVEIDNELAAFCMAQENWGASQVYNIEENADVVDAFHIPDTAEARKKLDTLAEELRAYFPAGKPYPPGGYPELNGWKLYEEVGDAESGPWLRVNPLMRRRYTQGAPHLYHDAGHEVWDDVVQFHYDNPETMKFMTAYWKRLVDWHVDVGFRGFRCDAAYMMKPELWRDVIGHTYDPEFVKRHHLSHYYQANSHLTWLAETVGGPGHLVDRLRFARLGNWVHDAGHPEPRGVSYGDWAAWANEHLHIVPANHPVRAEPMTVQDGPESPAVARPAFDYGMSWVKWRDMSDLAGLEAEQQWMIHIARRGGVGFPESHDTPRLSNDMKRLFEGRGITQGRADAITDVLRRNYAIAALGSNGVIMPQGYEFGSEGRLSVFHGETTPEQWQALTAAPQVDLRSYMRLINVAKAQLSPVNAREASRQVLHYDPNGRLVVMKRQRIGEPGDPDAPSVLMLIDRTPEQGSMDIDLCWVAGLVGRAPEQLNLAGKERLPAEGDNCSGVRVDQGVIIIGVPGQGKYADIVPPLPKKMALAAGFGGR